MLYAPMAGEVVARDFAARPLQPTTATLPVWERARSLAQTFWRTAAVLSACGGSDDDNSFNASNATRSVGSLRLIGQQVLPRRLDYASTVVGGLSGIDYDAVNKRYVLVSDDRTTTD